MFGCKETVAREIKHDDAERIEVALGIDTDQVCFGVSAADSCSESEVRPALDAESFWSRLHPSSKDIDDLLIFSHRLTYWDTNPLNKNGKPMPIWKKNAHHWILQVDHYEEFETAAGPQ